MSIRKIQQKQRILRVYALSKLYADYREIYINECILKTENNYFEAEKTSNFINEVFGGETKPTDFIFEHNKTINKLIDKANEFKDELKRIDKTSLGLNKKNVLAFCKEVEHGKYHILKSNIQFYYQTIALYNYSEGRCSKELFLEGMTQIDIFTKKRKTNNAYYKKTFLEVEKSYYAILRKQIFRSLK